MNTITKNKSILFAMGLSLGLLAININCNAQKKTSKKIHGAASTFSTAIKTATNPLQKITNDVYNILHAGTIATLPSLGISARYMTKLATDIHNYEEGFWNKFLGKKTPILEKLFDSPYLSRAAGRFGAPFASTFLIVLAIKSILNR